MEAPADSYVDGADGRKYWSGIDADVNGMLGGFPYISRVDLQGSRAFLAKMGVGSGVGKLRRVGRVLEGGAGIGRITEGLLVSVSETVDVVEPIQKFTENLQSKPGVGRVFNVGLEEWRPEPGEKYDIVWNQWCLGHLRDEELVEYLERCRGVLEEGGFVVVKENMSTSGKDIFDALDSAVTREDRKFRELFERAGLDVVRSEIQNGLPAGLHPVRSYALKPKAKP
ncbi:probable putative methyltransferase [Cephalotrichum gorgonifer]|uniref:Alpha N-terminal protein methyltransferase 1 n=1 Tax=Cephalotrichum gorgonifer TaxID=2041049 RepID=A0AAE8N116_9PEZI|nr:probable putative methyltransferase [Cephalotrichum gorgonifer]